ncbi:MAG: geranylgeranyl diphosphate reductase [Pseudomonadota bacterium]
MPDGSLRRVIAAEEADAVVVGGGPAGATAAERLAHAGRHVVMIDRDGRIKPCGGAIPPRLIEDFAIPTDLLCARATSARMIAPSDRAVDMPIENGFVGMVNREVFDEFLRERAAKSGADRRRGAFLRIDRAEDGAPIVVYAPDSAEEREVHIRAKVVVGADGARSKVARTVFGEAGETPCVFAYHEIVRAPDGHDEIYDPERCDVYYQGRLSPDFYAWVFPHGETASIGVGSAHKGFSLRQAVRKLRGELDIEDQSLVRREGAPIPMKPLKRWHDAAGVILAGDAAGVVAPSSGEGIYYAMRSADYAADAALEFLDTGKPKALARARKRFMKDHGRVFFILGMMQHFWYRNDRRREQFVSLCQDRDVQRMTWDAYMHKRLGRPEPAAHLRIFFKDLAHLFGLARA